MRNRWIGALLLVLVLVAVVVVWRTYREPKSLDPSVAVPVRPSLKPIVINEAARTLLYIPLYHAIEKGYFRDLGIDARVVTGGTATNSFAAMLSGEAEFSQADPMYVPISREKGSKTKVVAQVVGRIAMWGLAVAPEIRDMTKSSVQGKKISTHPQPMTAYTYTVRLVSDLGLDPEKNVEIIQSKPGTEIVPLLNNAADFAVTVEPSVSTAESEGAHVVASFPQLFGDRVLTGLMTTEEYIAKNRETVLSVVRAYQRALGDINSNPESAIDSARVYFPQLSNVVLQSALRRMVRDRVVPTSVEISEDSWNKAIAVRVEAGDLKAPSRREVDCALDIMTEASHK